LAAAGALFPISYALDAGAEASVTAEEGTPCPPDTTIDIATAGDAAGLGLRKS
jgi:hypothetical protein